MKRILIAIIALFCVHSTCQAQTAHWITVNDTLRNEPNTWMEFQKCFMLNRKPKKAEVRIAADTKYWLWVNGKLAVFEGGLKRGPNRTDTYYDVTDLAAFLKKGNNDVKILLCYFGKSGFSHVSSGQAGLIVDASSIGVVSDSSWRSRRLAAYGTAGKPFVNYRLAESNIRYDARLAGQGVLQPSVEIGEWGSAPWNKLVERPIPHWRDYGVKTACVKSTDDGHGNVVLSMRLPYNMQMTPIIDVTDNNGGTTLKIETDHVRGGSQDCVRAEYVTCRGRQSYESLGWMNGDVLRVIYPSDSNIKVNSVAYRETGYDTDFCGYFECNDSVINRFWKKAMRTLYVNMRDTYFDCPDRERAQWWGDVTTLMGESFYQLSPKANALMRKAMRELVDWQKSDGTLFSPIPAGNWNRELPAQMLTAISSYGFWYYYMHTGDKETMEYVYPAMRRYLSLWTLDADGLTVERNGGWAWGDWGTDIDMRLILASWHYMALRSAIAIAHLTEHEADVPDYEQQMNDIHTAFGHCWNGYAYRHPSYQDATDDRVQAMAILSGIADSSKYEQLFRIFQSQEYASPYMEKYVMEALMQIGHGDYALKRFKKRFGPMIADTLHTTLYEGWQEGGYGGGSTNHAWSGGMLTVIAEQICGVRPLTAGWRDFEVCPNPVLRECRIGIPTVRGLVESAFIETDNVFTLSVSVPAGTTAHIVLPPTEYSDISINGHHVPGGNIKPLGKGHYKIVCRKMRT